jgi:hypothetical protein
MGSREVAGQEMWMGELRAGFTYEEVTFDNLLSLCTVMRGPVKLARIVSSETGTIYAIALITHSRRSGSIQGIVMVVNEHDLPSFGYVYPRVMLTKGENNHISVKLIE